MEVDVNLEPVPETPIPAQPRIRGPHHAFASQDIVNLAEVFSQGPRVVQSVLWVFLGAFRTVAKVAVQEIVEGTDSNSELRATPR